MVEVVERTVAWTLRLRPVPDAPAARGLGPPALAARIGWCRLRPDPDGALRFLTAVRSDPRTLLVEWGGREWRFELEPPAGDTVTREVVVPPPPPTSR